MRNTLLLLSLLYYYHYLKYLTLKAGQLKKARRPRSTLNQAVKQPYGVCCLTGHVLKIVQYGDVNRIMMISRNISSFLNLAYSNILQNFISSLNSLFSTFSTC